MLWCCPCSCCSPWDRGQGMSNVPGEGNCIGHGCATTVALERLGCSRWVWCILEQPAGLGDNPGSGGSSCIPQADSKCSYSRCTDVPLMRGWLCAPLWLGWGGNSGNMGPTSLLQSHPCAWPVVPLHSAAFTAACALFQHNQSLPAERGMQGTGMWPKRAHLMPAAEHVGSGSLGLHSPVVPPLSQHLPDPFPALCSRSSGSLSRCPLALHG